VLEEYFRRFCLAKAQASQAIVEGEKNIRMIKSEKL